MTFLAMDLGKANTLIYVKGKGVVFNEPTAIAYANVRDLCGTSRISGSN